MDKQKVFIFVHQSQLNGLTRMIPQVFGSRETAVESLEMTIPKAMKLKSRDEWSVFPSGDLLSLRGLDVLTEKAVLK